MIVNKLPNLIISSSQFQLKKTEQGGGGDGEEVRSGQASDH